MSIEQSDKNQRSGSKPQPSTVGGNQPSDTSTNPSSSLNGTDISQNSFPAELRSSHRVFDEVTTAVSQRARDIIRAFNYPPGSALNISPNERPTRGQTTCLGKMDVRLEYGDFQAYLFKTRDVNGYVVALTKGDITTSENLLIRAHSECITSETLNACDCDCVEQLNGALQQIANEGRGVLFYLRQEGRGAGYEAKAMDRMMVIASNDEIGTFDAYNLMGLPRDARDYSSINDIVYLLGISAGLDVMTNNHRKISGLEAHGLKVAGRRQHSYAANPFNQHYMRTKAEKEGHTFDPVHLESEGAEGHIYPENEVHQSYVLADARRFIHRATYWLPIRPPTDDRILPTEVLLELEQSQRKLGVDAVAGFTSLSNLPGFVKISLNQSVMEQVRAADPFNPLDTVLANHPYFFKNHVYLDESTNLVFPVLKHENGLALKTSVPLVRIHTESVLARLPLAENPEREIFRHSIQSIVQNGKGLVLLYPKDGRGNGIGSVFEEEQLIKRGVASTPTEACDVMGTRFDGRDYTAVARLIKHHYPNERIDLILSDAEDAEQRGELFFALAAHGIQVRRYSEINGIDARPSA